MKTVIPLFLLLATLAIAQQVEVTIITNTVAQRINGVVVTNEYVHKVAKPVPSSLTSLEENLKAVGTNQNVTVTAILPQGGTNGARLTYQIVLKPK